MNTTAKVVVILALALAIGGVVVLKYNNPPEATTNEPEPSAELPRLVDLGSDTCIPCKLMAPILDELKAEYAGALRVEFYNVREDPDVGAQYGINLIPTQIFYDASGQERFRHEGFFSKEEILAKWAELGIELTKAAAETPATE